MKRLWCLVLLALAPGQLLAQTRPSLGIELGYARADFVGPGAGGVTQREGAVAGAYFRIPLSGWLALQPGLLISSKGGATEVADTSASPLRLELDLVYLDLPLVLRARLPFLLGTRLIVLGGGAPEARIGCNVESFRNDISLGLSACERASTASFRTWDVSVMGGVGLGIPIEKSELAFEARLSRGLRSVTDVGQIYNRSLEFLLSVPF
jgi:hypothetical protein